MTATTAWRRGLEPTLALLLVCSLALLLGSVYRAIRFPFTIDESLSFGIFTWYPGWAAKANNHLLNTTLMRWCSTLLGNSELSLRLPNVMAHAVYLLCTLALVRAVPHPGLRLAGFVLFNLNLFLLDFFSLARGYGLALAGEALALWLLVEGSNPPGRADRGWYVYSSTAAGALMVLANYSFLNVYLPLLGACLWVLLNDSSGLRVDRKQVPRALGLLAANGLFLLFVLRQILRLRRAGQLYVGGRRGFVSDTVGSLMRVSWYARTIPEGVTRILSGITVALFFGLMLWGAYRWWEDRRDRFGILAAILGGAVALPVLQHHFLRTVYPVERAAIGYVPLYAAVLLFGLDSWLGDTTVRWKSTAAAALSAAIAIPLTWHFVRHYRADTHYTWWHDAHNTEVLNIISRDHERAFPRRVVTLRVSSILIPSFNFYRITRGDTWLSPLARVPITRSDAQYIYAFRSDLDTVSIGQDTELASYPDIGSVLVRVEQHDRP